MTRPERENFESERMNHFLYNGKTVLDIWCDAIKVLVRLKTMHDRQEITDHDYVRGVKLYRGRIMNDCNVKMVDATNNIINDTTNIVDRKVTSCGNYRFSYMSPSGGGTNDCSICDEYDNVQFGIWCVTDSYHKSNSDMASGLDTIISDMMFTNNFMFRAMCK